MDPGEALGVTAQVAITLAGFAGVVAVFNKNAAHEWSPADRFRLQLMLLPSAVPLVFCMFGMLLLTTKLPTQTIWAICSGLTFVVAITFGLLVFWKFLHFRRGELESAGANKTIFFITVVVGCTVILLQLYNAILLGAFWPFFAILIFQIFIATLQFALLIFARRET